MILILSTIRIATRLLSASASPSVGPHLFRCTDNLGNGDASCVSLLQALREARAKRARGTGSLGADRAAFGPLTEGRIHRPSNFSRHGCRVGLRRGYRQRVGPKSEVHRFDSHSAVPTPSAVARLR